MKLDIVILLLFVIPFLGFISVVATSGKKETLISKLAFVFVSMHLLAVLSATVLWILSGNDALNIPEVTLFRSEEYVFIIDFYFDKLTVFFLLVGSFIMLLITRYSRYYMHLERGYKRFFATILFFYTGFSLTVLAGNFETLFMGWEILGISSFLLIGFYRERYLPVRNAVKVFSIYRIGDVGILLAMWASHHLWHENITFFKLHNQLLVDSTISTHSGIGLFIALCLLLAAAAKSAQFPFSSWLPRAMEGPTPSSAIFYGSLSVHLGVFLLLRTHPLWEHQWLARVLIGLIGLITAIMGYFIASVQSTIKTQVAYASVSQIGIMFITLSLGFENLVLFHFLGNAFLRMYQLLVSPSIVSYKIRDQFYHFNPERKSIFNFLPQRLSNSLYIWSLKEWNLDSLMNKLVFARAKYFGHRLDFLNQGNALFFLVPFYLFGVFVFFRYTNSEHGLMGYFPEVFSFIGLLLVFRAFSERIQPKLAWLFILMNHFWVALSIAFNEHFDLSHVVLYLSGVVVSASIGYFVLHRLRSAQPQAYHLNGYLGHISRHRTWAFIFLLASLGLMGFPITVSFIGEDLIFSHIQESQYLLATMNALGYVFSGIALIRMYSRLFLGPDVKLEYPTSLKSA